MPILKTKSLLFIFLALLSLDVILFGLTGTGAWFADSAGSGIAVISAGSLDLQVTRDPQEPSDLQPGGDFAPIGAFCARNTGTTTLKYRGVFESDNVSAQGLLPYLTVKAQDKRGGEWKDRVEVQGVPVKQNDPPLADYFHFPNDDPLKTYQSIVSGTLAPGHEDCYRLSVRLEANLPAEYRATSLDFLLRLNATQTNNPGW